MTSSSPFTVFGIKLLNKPFEPNSPLYKEDIIPIIFNTIQLQLDNIRQISLQHQLTDS